MLQTSAHLWLVAPYRKDREYTVQAAIQEKSITYRIDCHANHRGPYTGIGELMRQLVPSVYAQWPEHVIAHGTEILSVAPELKSLIEVSSQTLTSLAIPEERTRFYSRLRTLRLTHGLIDFMLGYLKLADADGVRVLFENVHHADTLDQECLAVMLRRIKPDQMHILVASDGNSFADETLQTALQSYTSVIQAQPLSEGEKVQRLKDWNIPEQWGNWLLQQAEGWRGIWEPMQYVTEALASNPVPDVSFEEGISAIVKHCSPPLRQELAQAYIESDGTSDNPLEKAAYDLMEPGERQQKHDAVADDLQLLHQWSLHLGAIPYHRERGQDPAHAGATALQEALDYCINMGYYEYTVALGKRGRAVVDREKQLDFYWTFTTKMTTSLAALGRAMEAEELYIEARAFTSEPAIHMQAAYATSMLYTRHHDEQHRDFQVAKGWINEAIAISKLFPDPKQRAFNTVFNQNGLALIEMRVGRPHEAIRLVSEGLERLNHELGEGEHMLHRSVLLYNRGQVYAGIGQLEKALADYTAVIEQDPYYSEYYFDRGNLYRRMGRHEEALADYEKAIACSPPYPEAYYNRGAVRLLFGQEEEALNDFNYVLELDPDYMDALINRSSLLYERGAYDAARQDVEHGLKLEPTNAQLLCTLGLLEMAEEHQEEAYQALTSALKSNPALLEAWTNRAILSFECGNADAAIDDLTQALKLGENATVYYNRGLAFETQGRWQEAVADFDVALSLSDEDAHDILYHRGMCYLKLGDEAKAQADFAAHLASGESEYADEIAQLHLAPVSGD